MEFLTNRKWKTTGGFTLVKYEWNDLDLALDHDQDKKISRSAWDSILRIVWELYNKK